MAEKFSEFGAPETAHEKRAFKKGDVVTIQRGRFFKTTETGWRIDDIDTRGYAVVKKTDPKTGFPFGESVSLKDLEKWNEEKVNASPALIDIMHPQEGESSGHTLEDFEHRPLASEIPELGEALDRELEITAFEESPTPTPFRSDDTLILRPVNVPKRPSPYEEPVAPEARVPSPPPKPAEEEKKEAPVYDNNLVGANESDFVAPENKESTPPLLRYYKCQTLKITPTK
jgi:hypothetical protein